MGEPYFVVRIDPTTARVVIGTKEELGVHALHAIRTNWLVDRPTGSFEAAVQIRYNSSAQPARVIVGTVPAQNSSQLGAQNEKNKAKLGEIDSFEAHFHSPCYGVAPGQLAVVYAGDQVLGGGWIDSAIL
jgi:tRNA-specific 2-thiouridylase